MNNINTLKEYYIKILDLYNNCVNMFTAINQSLSTSSPQVLLNYYDETGESKEIKIPSFIYLENKLDELKTQFNNLFDIPNSGDAWFENNSNMYKFHLVRSNISPQTPEISTNNLVASFTDNNYFKDLVNPKMYLKMNISNLTNNIEKIFVKKYIFYEETLFNILSKGEITSHEEYLALLNSGYQKGKDYDYYDIILDLPLKKEVYKSKFNIADIVSLNNGNPYTEYNIELGKNTLNYKLTLDTLEYNNQEDSSIRFLLKIGDYISLNNTNTEYYVKYVNNTTNEVIIEERVGHTALQTIEEDPNMFFNIITNDKIDFDYIQIPLEENQYIALFVGTIYNNVRSILSDGILLDLGQIGMIDEYGNKLLDSNGNSINYMTYYKTYCKNIGDILSGFSEVANPLLSEFDYSELENLQTSDIIKDLVTNTFNSEDILQVVPINKHLIDDSTSQEIISLHNQKGELNNKLSSINGNIDGLYNTLTNTDWSQEVTNSQLSIRQKLDEYYVERTQLTTQLNNIIDTINTKSIIKYDENLKYRIRGILKTDSLEEYIKTINNHNNVILIGIDVQYKYKSNYSTTTSLSSINTNTFTDWNQYTCKDKERYIRFNELTNKIDIDWIEESTTDNIIKWNQIDIPINQNEEVVIKVRYKYNIGQPFINLYTPWSDEETIVFPDNYKELVQLSEIIEENVNDTNSANFSKTLINDGYTEHVNNKLLSGNQVFYHMPENIYSGFNTSENNLLSLKDKLSEMSNNIDKYKELIEPHLNRKYKVYLEFDNQIIELFSGSVNKININDTNINDSFIKKSLRLIIKNTGENPVKLYSLFPGNSNIALIEDNRDAYSKTIRHYERVPMIVDNQMSPQYLGQWIYFRQNNPYTYEDIYFNDNAQNIQDKANIISNLFWSKNPNDYMNKNNLQILYPYKEHDSFDINLNNNTWLGLEYKDNSLTKYVNDLTKNYENKANYANKTLKNFYHYTNVEDINNIYLMRYEDIRYKESDQTIIYLTENDFISQFMNKLKEYQITDFNGAFLYPDIKHINNILVSNTDVNPSNYVSIDIGKDLVIPITFEYCLNNVSGIYSNPLNTITKSLYFDLKDSLYIDPVNYLIEITVNNNYSSLNNYLEPSNLLKSLSEE